MMVKKRKMKTRGRPPREKRRAVDLSNSVDPQFRPLPVDWYIPRGMWAGERGGYFVGMELCSTPFFCLFFVHHLSTLLI
jgi:hypothetical protein